MSLEPKGKRYFTLRSTNRTYQLILLKNNFKSVPWSHISSEIIYNVAPFVYLIAVSVYEVRLKQLDISINNLSTPIPFEIANNIIFIEIPLVYLIRLILYPRLDVVYLFHLG